MTAQLKKYTLVLLGIWLSAGMISLAWNLFDNHQERKGLALQTAQALLAQIQNTRTWISNHQGVYVPVTEHQQPNPHLADDATRDLTTGRNLPLTKISPAAMIRELSLIAADNKGVRFHITSLDPIHPENTPYAWEEPWLRGFTTTPQAISSIVTIDGERLFRFMAPMLLQKECLGCHAEKKIIRRHKGNISATGQPGQGAQFTIQLPAAKQIQPQPTS